MMPDEANPQLPNSADLSEGFHRTGLTRVFVNAAWERGIELNGVLDWEVKVKLTPRSEGLVRLSLSVGEAERYSTLLNLESGEFDHGRLEVTELRNLRSILGLDLDQLFNFPETLDFPPLIDPALHYSRSLRDPELLHFAAHSHHLRPDCIEQANAEILEDTFTLADRKWGKIFGSVYPEAQSNVAKMIGISHPSQIVFAPNTHEFCARLLSSIERTPNGIYKPIHVVTTDSEFHSFNRQIARYAENPLVTVTKVPTEPFDTFNQRLIEAASQPGIDLLFFSQVFFNSSFVVKDLERIVRAVKDPGSIIAIDGYHAFGAMPVDISAIEDRIFYMAGGYKYAQYGEGGAFLCVPPNCSLRPENTGWMAQFGGLSKQQTGGVQYPDDGFRFIGSTFDPAALYRLNRVSAWAAENNITPTRVYSYVKDLQELFVLSLDQREFTELSSSNLICNDLMKLGNFLTFRLNNADEMAKRFADNGIVVDSREDRLRIGFGVYHTERDVYKLIDRLSKFLK